ncbi:MAG TPA: sigma-70 family RNA polymerase sigma factor [Bacteroidales bacterium]|nr:sigma-70 family RNA polymerase sigma factor [Bacteroidales bacterium]
MDNFDVHINAPLIEECRKGNNRAQFTLYNQYSKAMYNIAYRILNNREDAEDILQDTFVDCFRNINSFRFESTFGAWLKRIVINKCINHLQKKKIDLSLTDNIPENIYEEEDETVYDISKIIKGIEMLPDGYRVILTLYLMEGYDHSEIAQIMGITESTSKSQYSRAKEKLRSQLSKN